MTRTGLTTGLALALLLTACGGGESSSGTSSVPVVTAGSPTAAPTATNELPWNGSAPASASYMITPSDHRSDRRSTSLLPSSCSGLMYGGDPITIPVSVSEALAAGTCVSPSTLATPKSSTFTKSG